MNITPRQMMSSRRQAGFSLIEMIGVLAIIAVLAVIIVPKVFSTIASSRITNAVGSISALKTAVSEFAGKYGTIPLSTNNGRIDDLLLTDNLLESRFVVKIGTQPPTPPPLGATWARAGGTWNPAGGANQTNQTRVICVTSTTGAPSAAAGSNYRLINAATNLPVGARVVSAVIMNATIAEAREMSLRLDGESNSTTAINAALADDAGKVVYAAPANGLTNVYVYLAHQ